MEEPTIFFGNNAIFKQNNAQKLFITFKMAYYCCFGSTGNLVFPDFLQKVLEHQLLCGNVSTEASMIFTFLCLFFVVTNG